MANTKKKVLRHEGSIIYESDQMTALADPFGAFFHIVPSVGRGLPKMASRQSIPWRALFGLGLILTYFFTGWSWIWAFFFAFWVAMDLSSGQTHLFEPVLKKQNPALYWVIVIIWSLLGAVSAFYYMDIF